MSEPAGRLSTSADTGAGLRDSMWPAVLLVGVCLLARLLYNALLCPYNLVEDEAHYWLWARHMDWSFYSKGPGIAAMIWASTCLFGEAEWAVRLPTAIANAAGALACAGLARDIARRAFTPGGSVAGPSHAALAAAAMYLLAPAFQVTGFLVTIDGCYLACWAIACWATWRALAERSISAWLVIGLAVGIGFLFKYTILLLPPGLLIFALVNRRSLRLARSWRVGLAAAIVLALVAFTPVIYWNAREGWPTLRHLLGHLGLRGGDVPLPAPGAGDKGSGYNPLWTITYIFSPLGMFGPAAALGVVAALRILRRRQSVNPDGPGQERRLGASFLVWAAAPILAFYLAVSFVAEPEQNWPIAGFVSLLTLAGWYAVDELNRRRAGARDAALTGPDTPRTRPIKVLWRLSLIYGLCAGVLLHRADVAAEVLNRITAMPPVPGVIKSITGREPKPIVVGRLIGAKVMASDVADELDRLNAEGQAAGPAFVMAEHYGRASQMAYYLHRAGRHPVVLSSQSAMGGRKSQFDFWPDTALNRSDLMGRSAIILSNDKSSTIARLNRMFERVEPYRSPDGGQKLAGEHKKDRVAYIGHGYRGVGSDRAQPADSRDASTPQQ